MFSNIFGGILKFQSKTESNQKLWHISNIYVRILIQCTSFSIVGKYSTSRWHCLEIPWKVPKTKITCRVYDKVACMTTCNVREINVILSWCSSEELFNRATLHGWTKSYFNELLPMSLFAHFVNLLARNTTNQLVLNIIIDVVSLKMILQSDKLQFRY